MLLLGLPAPATGIDLSGKLQFVVAPGKTQSALDEINARLDKLKHIELPALGSRGLTSLT